MTQHTVEGCDNYYYCLYVDKTADVCVRIYKRRKFLWDTRAGYNEFCRPRAKETMYPPSYDTPEEQVSAAHRWAQDTILSKERLSLRRRKLEEIKDDSNYVVIERLKDL